MSIDTWFAFILACSILCFTPGPTVLLVVGQAFMHGRTSALPLVLGVLCGDIIALSLSLVGVGSILALSSQLFLAMKWCGALYLIYLGIKAFTKKHDLAINVAKETNDISREIQLSAFRQSLIVTALNPKGIIFFMAFFPLFIEPNAPLIPQLFALIVSFILVSGLSASSYVLAASKLVHHLKNPKFGTYFSRASGGMLVTAGVLTASVTKD